MRDDRHDGPVLREHDNQITSGIQCGCRHAIPAQLVSLFSRDALRDGAASHVVLLVSLGENQGEGRRTNASLPDPGQGVIRKCNLVGSFALHDSPLAVCAGRPFTLPKP